MKNPIINFTTLILGMFLTSNVNAQSNVWAKTNNIGDVVHSTEFTHFTNEMSVKITKPLSNSRSVDLQNVYQIECDCDVTDLYVAMHKVPGLEGIEYGPNYEGMSEPNDYNTTFENNWALDLIGAQTAWDITTGDENVVVAVSDQNYWSNHEELVGKYVYYDTTNSLSQGHGTAVATLVAGNTNNGIGTSSIGYNTMLSLHRMNYNEVLSASYMGARVINMSWASSCSFNTYVQAALNEVYNNGTFLIASGGNGGTCGGPTNLVYPAAYDNVFAVSSIGVNDNHERTIGNPNSTHHHNSSIDIMAPGYDVPLTAAPGWYLTGSGTSFAAPIVSGTVGLMVSAYPEITNQEIDSILRATAVNIDEQNPNYVGLMGSGRLNAGLAVSTAYRLSLASDVVDDGNNGHGNDEDGWDDSNPGQGHGNNGNGGGVHDKPNKPANDVTTTIKMAYNGEVDVYDMNGKKVNLNDTKPGMYLIVNNGIITKIIK